MVDDYRLGKDLRWLGVFYKPYLILAYILHLPVHNQSIYYSCAILTHTIKGGRGPTTWSRYRLSTGGLGNLIEVHGMISLCVLCRCCHGNWFGNLGLGIKKCQFLCDLVCVSRQVWYGVYIVNQYEEQFTIFSCKRMYTTYWDKGSLYFCGISVAHKIY